MKYLSMMAAMLLSSGCNQSVKEKERIFIDIDATPATQVNFQDYGLDESKPITLKLLSYRAEDFNLWQTFNSENLLPGVKVQLVYKHNDIYSSEFAQALATNNFDVALLKQNDMVRYKEIIADEFSPLTVQKIENLIDGSSSQGIFNNTFYALLGGIQIEGLIYNKQMFADFGWKFPTNEQEFKQTLEDILADGITPIELSGFDSWTLGQIVSETLFAGAIDNDIRKKLNQAQHCFNSSEVIAALTKLRNLGPYLSNNRARIDYQQMHKNFAFGRAAFMMSGAKSVAKTSFIYDINPNLDLGFLPLMLGEKKLPIQPDYYYVIDKDSTKQQAAQALINFTTTHKFGQLYIDLLGEVPPVVSNYVVDVTDFSVFDDLQAALNIATSVNHYANINFQKDHPLSYERVIERAMRYTDQENIEIETVADYIQGSLNLIDERFGDTCPSNYIPKIHSNL